MHLCTKCSLSFKLLHDICHPLSDLVSCLVKFWINMLSCMPAFSQLALAQCVNRGRNVCVRVRVCSHDGKLISKVHTCAVMAGA